jgi:hypothetical protein
VGDVEVVRLRTNDGRLIDERGMRVALTPCEKLEIRADTDDLGGGIEGSSEIFDDCGREPTVRYSNAT